MVDPEFKIRLLEAEKAALGYPCSSKVLSVFQAMENRMVDRQRGKHILEVQIASGGVIDPTRGIRVPPEVALQQGLLNNAILQFLHEPSSNSRVFPNPNNKQALYYSELLRMCVFDVDSQCFLFPFGEKNISNLNVAKTHRIAVVDTRTGAELTAYEAFQRTLIEKSTYLELSGQQYQWKEATFYESYGQPCHMLTDAKTGLQFSISEAVEQGTIDKAAIKKYQEGLLTLTELADSLLSQLVPKKDVHSPIAGYWLTSSGERISVLKASRRNLIDRITALRCLEAQVSTGGIIDPLTGKRYRVAEALHRGLVDEGFAQQLRQCELVITGVSHPVTNKVMSVVERAPRQREGNLPLPDRHLHHLGGPQVEVQPAHLRHGLHRDVALFRDDLVANCIHPRRHGPHRGPVVDSMRHQPQRVRLCFFILHRDRNHHRLWLPGHHGQVPGGHHPPPHPVGVGVHCQRFHGGVHVC